MFFLKWGRNKTYFPRGFRALEVVLGNILSIFLWPEETTKAKWTTSAVLSLPVNVTWRLFAVSNLRATPEMLREFLTSAALAVANVRNVYDDLPELCKVLLGDDG